MALFHDSLRRRIDVEAGELRISMTPAHAYWENATSLLFAPRIAFIRLAIIFAALAAAFDFIFIMEVCINIALRTKITITIEMTYISA